MRLVTRFAQGYSANITKPDLPTRVAILRNKAEQENLNIPNEERNPSAKVKFITTEDFINDFTDALRRGANATEAFKQEYRSADLLLVDDIQFLADKDKIQEEFFHTYDFVTQSILNPEFRFETFVSSDENGEAYAVAQAVADNPGTQWNPLLIYGGVGLGKTHLMQAIGNKV
ncbi:hypothetical protein H7R52_01445 [Weissella confusa]|uniref:Chromosomal replication initiator protein DnaA ATPAse domain-containing protein n=1 Tax=Weissella confusa TaxID=1583 RepID=A0A923NEE0_WEICO|nr:hypothetical protein [Weissella confusa]